MELNDELYDVLDFAKIYAGLGRAVQEQLHDLAGGAGYHLLNPNAVAVIRDKLAGMHAELDMALDEYEEWRVKHAT